MRFRNYLALLAVASWSAMAQAPLSSPAPLVPASTGASAGSNALTLVAAQRALELGFPSTAVLLYRPLVDARGVDRDAVILALATALLDEGNPSEAAATLEKVSGPRTSAWHLRAGLAAAQQNKVEAARNEIASIRPTELTDGDRSWWLFLQGLVADLSGDNDKAKAFYTQAEDSAPSLEARARFILRHEETYLRAGSVTAADADRTRRNLEQFQGRKVSYGIARSYAAMLDILGRKGEAVTVLQHQLVILPPEERADVDETRLLLGLIAGASDGAGRNALQQLLERGTNRDKQRVALQLLAPASREGAARADFRQELDRLIALDPPHPVLEDLLLFRAEVALADKNYLQAEEDARALLQKFPGSPLKAHAFSVLAGSAWEQRRYRTAADDAVQARRELAAPTSAVHAQLGLLVAEAWFRAALSSRSTTDFRNAADAYAAALHEVPPGVEPGVLMFQRVAAEIEAGTLDVAANVLDTLAKDPAFDVVNRWQAEWNLARALQVQDKAPEAYARVTRALAGTSSETLPADLRVRMLWLQVQLSAKVGQPEQTLKLVESLGPSLQGISPTLKNEIASSSELLRAEANFALDREAAALDILQKLRANFPRSDAAVRSYFDEADHYARQDKTVEAQQLLIKLADEFPDNQYAPYALYLAALQAERRGQEANLVEANNLIEQMVTNPRYANSDLIFYARLKQGDLLRKLNQFPQAQRAYEDLVNKYSQRSDVVLAQLALAETHNAQSAREPSHLEAAIVLFEHVRDRVDAPLDARVEAGFNLGALYLRRNQPDRAEQVWWQDVVGAFLLNERIAPQLKEKGSYWMTRTLLELGALYEQQEKLEQARKAWQLILTMKLPGESLAKARLARFGLPEGKP